MALFVTCPTWSLHACNMMKFATLDPLLNSILSYTLLIMGLNLPIKSSICTAKYSVPKIGKKYSQKGNCAASVPNFYIDTVYLWVIYTIPRSVCLFGCSKIGRPFLETYKSLTDILYECRNWDLGRAVWFLGIHKSDLLGSVRLSWATLPLSNGSSCSTPSSSHISPLLSHIPLLLSHIPLFWPRTTSWTIQFVSCHTSLKLDIVFLNLHCGSLEPHSTSHESPSAQRTTQFIEI